MEQVKSNAGRKPLAKGEKAKPVQCYIKGEDITKLGGMAVARSIAKSAIERAAKKNSLK